MNELAKQQTDQEIYIEFDNQWPELRECLFGFAMRLVKGNRADAEDLLSDTFIKARNAYPDFQGNSILKTWVHQILKNTFISKRRDAMRASRKLEAYGKLHEVIGPQTTARVDQGLSAKQVLPAALESVEPEAKEALILQSVFGHSIEHIAKKIGKGPEATKSLLFRTKRKLKAILESQGIFATV